MRYAVLVCTMDRPQHLTRLLHQLASEPVSALVVVDASSGDESRRVLGKARLATKMIYERATPSLARQRNRALELGLSESEADYLCFLDDDGILSEGFFDAIGQVIRRHGAPAGVGGVVDDDHPRPTGWAACVWSGLKRVFLLDGRPGSILQSGRNIMVRDVDHPVQVEWLQGGAMCLRRDVAAQYRFDERLVGYAWGEDFDLTYQISHGHNLVQTSEARVRNLREPAGRASARRRAHRETVLRHAWVAENQHRGLSRGAFWWSVVGELILYPLVGAIGRRPEWLNEVRGILEGAVTILRHESSRSFDLP